MTDIDGGAPAPARTPALVKFVRDILTEKDNATWCLVRVTTLASTLCGLGLMAFTAVTTHAFDFKGFCEGCAVMIASTGAAIGVKAFSKAEAGQ